MNTPKSVWVGLALGSAIGSFIPNLWGAGEFSFSAVFLGAAGAMVGIYIGWKMR